VGNIIHKPVIMGALLGASALTLVRCLGREAPTDAPGPAEAGADAGGDASPMPEAAGDAPGSPDAHVADCLPSIAGIVLWLDDTSIVRNGAKIARWKDLSGNGLDAVPSALSIPSVGAGALNGHDIVKVAGLGSYLSIPDANALHWGTDDCFVALVTSWTNDPGTGNCSSDSAGILFGHQALSYPFWGVVIFADVPAPWPASSGLYAQVRDPCAGCACSAGNSVQGGSGLNDGRFRLVGARLTHPLGQPMFEIRLGGQSLSSIAVMGLQDLSATDGGILLGAGVGGGQQQVQGAYAAILAVHGTLPDAQMQSIEACLTSTYGL
jgi:hypothetical protein